MSLFIDPVFRQIDAAAKLGVETVELHTGLYCDARDSNTRKKRLMQLISAARYAHTVGLRVSAGHGLNYDNIKPVAAIAQLEWFNIGHSIVARALFVGMERATREMLALLRKG